MAANPVYNVGMTNNETRIEDLRKGDWIIDPIRNGAREVTIAPVWRQGNNYRIQCGIRDVTYPAGTLIRKVG